MKRADANALAELGVYEREFPEHRALASNRRSRAETLDYAVWFRRRTVELTQEVAEGDDLGELLRLVTWFGAQTPRGSGAYLDA
ncbi:hypothetical protein [Amycolatopsis azurea]|uniref:Uncharacterized protein n=1 Tax=Amycolatopsis azurea DSM 43854 TaxID=1238180 RepID=M2QAA7_9PSEU|nr:hypothetical protein [Amycolatopsis azurea]EMD23641.1 hypothetical protein C791_7031 [Amycolatopsis azurea DSM 43854]OOC01091.1 hypothetical protein B0293_39430 [Amycolatopsis azurea DSM 43854]